MRLYSHYLTKQNLLRQLRHGRAFLIGFAVIFMMLTATVAIAQKSQDFDLACRSVIASGGRVSTAGNFSVLAALGLPIEPPRGSGDAPHYSIRGGAFGVRAGFLPGYPTGQSAVIANSDQSSPAIGEQANLQHLPLIQKALVIARGGC